MINTISMEKRKRIRGVKARVLDRYPDAIFNEDGSWSAKQRMTDREAKEFLSSQSLFSLNKDEEGYYFITGELVCTVD